jgi:HEAT repeats
MASEQLQGLAADVNRLLAAGAAAAPGDAALARRGRALDQLRRQVPALGDVSDAVRELVRGRDDPPRGLLRLLAVARPVWAALAEPGVGVGTGVAQPVGPSGPWQTPLPPDRLFALTRGLTLAPLDAREGLESAEEQGPVTDLRLVDPFFTALDNHGVRRHLAEDVLPAFGRALLPDLYRLLGTGDNTFFLLRALCRIDEPAGGAYCLRLARHGPPNRLYAALDNLPAGVPAEEVNVLARELLPRAGKDTWRVLDAWEKRGRPGPEDVPLLLPLLRSADDLVRVNAAEVLAAVGPTAACAVPAMREVLRSLKLPPHGSLATLVLDALGNLGPAARECLPDLPRFARMRHEDHARAALRALARIDGLDRVLEFLRQPDSRRRAVAASALGTLGTLAAPAVPALEASLGDPVIGSRFAAAAALVELGRVGNRVLTVLLEGLNGKGYLRRREALEVLTRLGPRAAAAVPVLEKLAAGKDYFLREGALAALRAIRRVS